MAFIADFRNPDGYVYPKQYIRIREVLLGKDVMDIFFEVFLSPPQGDDTPHLIDRLLRRPYDMYSDMNVWQQAYAEVKPLFDSPIDC